MCNQLPSTIRCDSVATSDNLVELYDPAVTIAVARVDTHATKCSPANAHSPPSTGLREQLDSTILNRYLATALAVLIGLAADFHCTTVVDPNTVIELASKAWFNPANCWISTSNRSITRDRSCKNN